MALPSIMHRFEIELSDVDEGRYESLDLRVARHPSEGLPYLMTRVLVWTLRRGDDLDMSKAGLSTGEAPALLAYDLTGRMRHWVDIGRPSAERIHKASKTAQHVSIYTYKNGQSLVDALNRATVHRRSDIDLFEVDADFLEALARTLDRSNHWTIVRTDGAIYVTAGETTLETTFIRWPLEAG
ncbi:MAG: YaeQ family protein [Myxococcota bacterium]|nr:YaeQ family protein [Myxococcota bacterium]